MGVATLKVTSLKFRGVKFFSHPNEDKPMHNDATRKALEAYLPDLEIIHDDPTGCTVAPYKIQFGDNKWCKVNYVISQLGGVWVKSTRFTKGHWRIPKNT